MADRRGALVFAPTPVPEHEITCLSAYSSGAEGFDLLSLLAQSASVFSAAALSPYQRRSLYDVKCRPQLCPRYELGDGRGDLTLRFSTLVFGRCICSFVLLTQVHRLQAFGKVSALPPGQRARFPCPPHPRRLDRQTIELTGTSPHAALHIKSAPARCIISLLSARFEPAS